jgi:hypothetical protein
MSLRFPFDDPHDFTGAQRAPSPLAAAVPLSTILKPVELDPLTVVDDEKFLEKLAHQPNVLAPIKTGLRDLY